MDPTDEAASRNYRGATGAERLAQRRRELIDAGIEVFGTVGFRAATVDGVCTAAGLTKRYFYESFTDREELFIASYRASSDALLAVLDASAKQPASTPEARVRAFLDVLFEVCRDHPQMARIVLLEALGVSDAVDTAHRASTDRFIELTLSVGSELAPLDTLDDQHRYLLGAGLVGAALQLLREWVLQGYTPDAERLVDALQFTTLAVIERVVADADAAHRS